MWICTHAYVRTYIHTYTEGGHVIMLGPGCEEAAIAALTAYSGGLQIGGGINLTNANKFLEAGASHVVVTSFVFQDGEIQFDRLKQLVELVGKEKIVLDLSCRKKTSEGDDLFYVVTNKWTKYTNFAITKENVIELANYCDEFLVHGVDVEGKKAGIDLDLVTLLGEICPIPVTYAGGVRSMEDVALIETAGKGKVHYTIGSALDIFGGDLSYASVVERSNGNNRR